METPPTKQLTELEVVLRHSIARYDRAATSFGSEAAPHKIFEIIDHIDPQQVFEIPMVSYQWSMSFEGMETMLIDDNPERTICLCRTTGSVRLPQYSHRRNERIIIISGKIIDHFMGKEYGVKDIIDYPLGAMRDWEFCDAMITIILTPPLDFKKKF